MGNKTDLVLNVGESKCSTFDTFADLPSNIALAIENTNTGTIAYVAMTDDEQDPLRTPIQITSSDNRSYWLVSDVEEAGINYTCSKFNIPKLYPNTENNFLVDMLWYKGQWLLIEAAGHGSNSSQAKLAVKTSPDGSTWTTQCNHIFENVSNKVSGWFTNVALVNDVLYIVYKVHTPDKTGGFYLLKNDAPTTGGQWQQVSYKKDAWNDTFVLKYISNNLYVLPIYCTDGDGFKVSLDGKWEYIDWVLPPLNTTNYGSTKSLLEKNGYIYCLSGTKTNATEYARGRELPLDSIHPIGFTNNYLLLLNGEKRLAWSDTQLGAYLTCATRVSSSGPFGIQIMNISNSDSLIPKILIPTGDNAVIHCQGHTKNVIGLSTGYGLIFAKNQENIIFVPETGNQAFQTICGNTNSLLCLANGTADYYLGHLYTFN